MYFLLIGNHKITAYPLQPLRKHVWWKLRTRSHANKDSCCKMFTKRSLGCGLFHILLVMMTSAEYLSTSWVQSFQLFPSEWELCSYWVILISLQSLQRPDCTLDVLYVDRSPAPDPVDSKLSLPSRVRQSDGLGQGTLPGTFDCWHVFWSIASPLLKKNIKNKSQSVQIST